MSALSKYTMEQWVLAGALLGFGAVLGVRALQMPSAKEGSVFDGGKDAEAYDPQPLVAALENWGQRVPLEKGEHAIYVSRLIVYKPQEKKVEWLDPESKLNGIQVSWLIDNGYSLEDPAVPNLDDDRDGFTTREEFEQGTNPRDRASHPPLITKLFLKDYENIPFRLIFRGYSKDATGDGWVFQINLKDAPARRTRLVRQGENVEGYTIGAFRQIKIKERNVSTGIDEVKDMSELDIINPKLNETIALVLNVEKEMDESRVVFDLQIPDQAPEPAEVRRGDTFTVAGKSYRLFAATRDTATIKGVDEEGELTIRRTEAKASTLQPITGFE